MHIHEWQIEIANGPYSPGICHGCGETRQFANTMPDDVKWQHSVKNAIQAREIRRVIQQERERNAWEI